MNAISPMCACVQFSRDLAQSQRDLVARAALDDNNTISIELDGYMPKFVRLPSAAGSHPVFLAGASDTWHTYQVLPAVVVPAFDRPCTRARSNHDSFFIPPESLDRAPRE